MTQFWIVAALLATGGLLFLIPPLWGAERRERALALGVALAFPLAVGGTYLAAGTPSALAPPGGDAKGAPHSLDQQRVLAMVSRLAERMRTSPEDVEGWVMLGRTYATIGRYQDAAIAYERAVERLPNDARLLADAADIAAMAQGRRLAGKPEELVERALAVDPRNLKALSLAGTAAFEKGDYARAIDQWRRILAVVPAGSDAERSVRGSIADAERKMGATAKAPQIDAPHKGPVAAGASIEGRVEIVADLKGRIEPDDTVFLFARVPGERAPRALLRRRAADLPMTFRLDDSLAMNPAAKLSNAKEVIVVARVSRSGTASTQPGDLEGASGALQPGAKGVVVRIDSEAKR